MQEGRAAGEAVGEQAPGEERCPAAGSAACGGLRYRYSFLPLS